jgi:hypothetical protein
MKKVFRLLPLLILASGIYSSASAQIRKIPAGVTEAFKDKYPNASQVEWKDKLTNFVAVFQDNGIQYEARFNKKGEWKDTENAIDTDELPEAVNEGYGKSKYAGDWKIEAAFKIQLPNEKVNYRVLARKSDLQKKNILFNSEGRLLKDNMTL